MTDTSGLRIKLEAAQHRVAELEELLVQAADHIRYLEAADPSHAKPYVDLLCEIDSALVEGKER
jgi:hypothetical protein